MFQFWFIRIRNSIHIVASCTTHLVRIVQKMNEFESIKSINLPSRYNWLAAIFSETHQLPTVLAKIVKKITPEMTTFSTTTGRIIPVDTERNRLLVKRVSKLKNPTFRHRPPCARVWRKVWKTRLPEIANHNRKSIVSEPLFRPFPFHFSSHTWLVSVEILTRCFFSFHHRATDWLLWAKFIICLSPVLSLHLICKDARKMEKLRENSEGGGEERRNAWMHVIFFHILFARFDDVLDAAWPVSPGKKRTIMPGGM